MTAKIGQTVLHPITISGTMVILPIDEYNELLVEAGYLDVPELEKEVAEAESRYRKGKSIPWDQFKSDASEI